MWRERIPVVYWSLLQQQDDVGEIQEGHPVRKSEKGRKFESAQRKVGEVVTSDGCMFCL